MSEWQAWATVSEAPTDEFGVIGRVLVSFGKEGAAICYFDPYYAKGGHGYEGHSGWVVDKTGESVELHYTHEPTHWMLIPKVPE